MRVGAGGKRLKFTILPAPIAGPSPPLLFIPGLLEFSKPLRWLLSVSPPLSFLSLLLFLPALFLGCIKCSL